MTRPQTPPLPTQRCSAFVYGENEVVTFELDDAYHLTPPSKASRAKLRIVRPDLTEGFTQVPLRRTRHTSHSLMVIPTEFGVLGPRMKNEFLEMNLAAKRGDKSAQDIERLTEITNQLVQANARQVEINQKVEESHKDLQESHKDLQESHKDLQESHKRVDGVLAEERMDRLAEQNRRDLAELPVVLFSLLAWLAVEYGVTPQGTYNRDEHGIDDHEVKTTVLSMVEQPDGWYRHRFWGDRHVREHINLTTIQELNQALRIDDRNMASHLESSPVTLLSKLLVLDHSAYQQLSVSSSSSSSTPTATSPATRGLYMMVATLRPRNFQTLLGRIREDRGRTLRPLNDEQVARLKRQFATTLA